MMAQRSVCDLFMDTADIIFVVDNKEIPGHRLVLAKTCDYFDKLLFGEFRESKSNKVEISGVSAKVFTEVLRFTYKGQLEVKEWTIEDLMSLLSVAHEYQFWSLFSAVIQAVEEKPLDFGSWSLVNSAASVYDSALLRKKCASFAEDKIDDFIRENDLEKYSADFICCMLDCPKMSSFNQDHVVRAICNWKKSQSSSDLMSVIQKISFENVSSKLTFGVVRELFSTVKNVEEYKFRTKLSADIHGPSRCFAEVDKPAESSAKNYCMLIVDSLVLRKDTKMKFALPKNKGNLICWRDYVYIVCAFIKGGSLIDIPVQRLEFEAEIKFSIERIFAYDLKGGTLDMVVFEPTANNGCFKYSAVFSESTPVFSILIFSDHFVNMREISLRNVFIY